MKITILCFHVHVSCVVFCWVGCENVDVCFFLCMILIYISHGLTVENLMFFHVASSISICFGLLVVSYDLPNYKGSEPTPPPTDLL